MEFEEMPLPVSVYAADLIQLEAKDVGMSGWQDDEAGAEGDPSNLWLNLSSGFIGGGRMLFDGTGGSGSAKRHYESTDRLYPLVVKLGTITSEGADVWSYGEEEFVTDPFLREHLLHWGINMDDMQKTVPTMMELEVEATRELRLWAHGLLDAADGHGPEEEDCHGPEEEVSGPDAEVGGPEEEVDDC